MSSLPTAPAQIDSPGAGFPYWLFPLVGAWGYGAWLYGKLPPSVPLHWNFAGQVDRYGGPAEAAFLLPAIMTVTAALLFLALRRQDHAQFLLGTILGFIFCIELLIGYSSSTGHLPALIGGVAPYWAAIPVALSWAYAAWLYTRLPAVVPIHWNIRGEVDGWAGRTGGAFLLPGVFTLLQVVMLVISRQAPLLLVSVFFLAMQVAVSRMQLKYTPTA